MSKWRAITDKRYGQTIDVPNFSKNQRESLLLRLANTNCSADLDIFDQELLTSLRNEMKLLLTELMSAHPNNFCGGTHGFFFAEPHCTGSVLDFLTQIIVVDFGRPVSELQKNAISWPGGGKVVAEYCGVQCNIETKLSEHWALWSPRYSDEVIRNFIFEVRDRLLSFVRAELDSTATDGVTFIDAVAYMHAQLPALETSMRECLDQEKENHIEAEIHEGNFGHEDDVDMSVFD